MSATMTSLRRDVITSLLLLLLLVTLTSARPSDAAAGDESGCVGLGYCCPGRNVTCSSTGRSADSKDATSTCFCDEECLTIGDCCLDYRAACPPVDCELADDWQPWSECDARCGYGVQVRQRAVLQHAVNGGRECPATVERRLCEGTRCKLPRSHHATVSQLKETASIVSASYAGWRSDALYSPFEDIRQNLFTHFKYAQLKNDLHTQPSYCAKFQVTETRRACRRHGWTRRLTPGTVVCVECQQFAAVQASMDRRHGSGAAGGGSGGGRCAGHGVYERETAWKAVSVRRCHGKWTLVSRHVQPCECDPRADTSFVFV